MSKIDWKNKEERRLYHKEYRLRHKEKYASYMKEYENKRRPLIKNQIYKLLGDKCNSCKITDRRVLDVDHVNGGGNKERKARGSLNYYTRILRAIESGSTEYRILCRNCNWIAHLDSNKIT